MRETPFLTIGIASYNYGKYLEKAFTQIKKQRFIDFELLYCDDGSTDDSVEIIENIIVNNPDINIRLIKGENQGILANKNRILQNARGKYLLICDADDYISDDCLEKLCKKAQEDSADCVIGGFCEIDDNNRSYKIHIPSQNANPWIFIWHHAQIYKTDLIRRYQLSFDKIPDDVCYIQRIHMHTQNISYVSEVLYYWVRHADSTSRDVVSHVEWHPNKLWSNIVDCMQEILTEIEDRETIRQIHYFLYKWFYFNVTDLPVAEAEELKCNLRDIQKTMKTVFPDYRRFATLYNTLRAQDTGFARLAIGGCWIVERMGLLVLLPKIRSLQQQIRST